MEECHMGFDLITAKQATEGTQKPPDGRSRNGHKPTKQKQENDNA